MRLKHRNRLWNCKTLIVISGNINMMGFVSVVVGLGICMNVKCDITKTCDWHRWKIDGSCR